MSQMSHLKQKNGKVLETLLLSPGKTENPRYVLPPRGRRQADTPTIDTTVVRQRLTLRRGARYLPPRQGALSGGQVMPRLKVENFVQGGLLVGG